MRIAELLGALLPLSVAAASFKAADTSGTDRLARIALNNVVKQARAPAPFGEESQLSTTGQPGPQRSYVPPSGCTPETASVRREWDTLCADEKRAYIAAVQCLLNKPGMSSHLAPGARSRHDDFVTIHINRTTIIHGTGIFLAWHRYFTWAYEQALRIECGYRGVFPYINWARVALDLMNAPIFDGSDTSMSGNGEPDPRNNGSWIPSQSIRFIRIPPGSGGGCVRNGPFANMTVRLGPIAPALRNIEPNPQEDGFGDNPRCLRRDMSPYAASRWANDDQLVALIANSSDLLTFQNVLQGNLTTRVLGAHGAGHFMVGGDPGGDFYNSPADPFFFLQHSQVDRMWWIWQNQCPEDRINIVAGKNNPLDPNAPDSTLDDLLDMGVNGPEIKLRDAVDTMKGPFCYIYE